MPKKKDGSFIFKAYLSAKKHWFVFSLIVFFPTVYSQLADHFGVPLKLVAPDAGGFTAWGSFLYFLSVFISFGVIALKNWYNYKEERDSIGGNTLLKKILYCVNNICRQKYDTLLTVISGIRQNNTEPPDIVTNPEAQIKTIISQLSECVTTFTPIKKYNLVITIALQHAPFECNEWEWTDSSKEFGLPLDELLSNPSTSFYMVYSGTQSYIFYNDKKEAETQRHYIMDERDKSCEGIGSILCTNITTGNSREVHTNAILSIATYGQKFVSDDDEAAVRTLKDNFMNVLLPEFILRLQVEISLLYIRHLKDYM